MTKNSIGYLRHSVKIVTVGLSQSIQPHSTVYLEAIRTFCVSVATTRSELRWRIERDLEALSGLLQNHSILQGVHTKLQKAHPRILSQKKSLQIVLLQPELREGLKLKLYT